MRDNLRTMVPDTSRSMNQSLCRRQRAAPRHLYFAPTRLVKIGETALFRINCRQTRVVGQLKPGLVEGIAHRPKGESPGS